MRRLVSALAVLLLIAVPTAVSAQSDPWAKAERKPGRIGQIASRMNEEAWFVPGGLVPSSWR
jgi:hypothetical protein